MTYTVIGLIILVVLAVVPFALIWSLNALFALSIGYTFKTWFAALLLAMLVGSNGASRSK